MPINVRFKMQEGAEDLAPTKAHEDDAAWDLRSRVDLEAQPGKVTLIPTGLFLELPPGYEAQIRPRSGLALKHAVTLLNTPGTIDAGYRGEVCVILVNLSSEPFVIERGERIAQLVLARHEVIEWEQTDELAESGRGAGGFGSTGK